jgi:hypothetical protein
MSTSVCISPNPINQASVSLGLCKRCGSPELFIKQQSVHLGLFCRECNLWQQWISKSAARRYQKVQLTEPAQPYPEVGERIGLAVDTPQDVIARLERLEKAFAGYDSQLGILVRAILACGVLSGAQSPPLVNVDDNLVDRFVRELAEDQ